MEDTVLGALIFAVFICLVLWGFYSNSRKLKKLQGEVAYLTGFINGVASETKRRIEDLEKAQKD